MYVIVCSMKSLVSLSHYFAHTRSDESIVCTHVVFKYVISQIQLSNGLCCDNTANTTKSVENYWQKYDSLNSACHNCSYRILSHCI